MLIVSSHNDVPIRLTEERWRHVVRVHSDGLPYQPAIGQEGDDMEAVKILEKPTGITWDYDEEADVLYLSIGEPQPAVGIDIGEGVILRYDEVRKEVVGLTLIGLRGRLLKGLASSSREAVAP